jgi:hypothetical protein
MHRTAVLLSLILPITGVGCGKRQTPDTEPINEPVEAEATTGPTEGERRAVKTKEEPRKILASAIKAFGGVEKLSRWDVGKLKYRVTGSMLGAMQSPQYKNTVIEETFQYPDYWKRIVWTDILGKKAWLMWVYNKGTTWEGRMGVGAVPYETPVKEQDEHVFARLIDLRPIHSSQEKLEIAGEETLGGRDTVVIRTENGMELYFDKQRHTLTRTKALVTDPRTGRKALTITDFRDYKEVQGGALPMRIQVYTDGKMAFDLTFIEVQFLESIDEAEFRKPDKK